MTQESTRDAAVKRTARKGRPPKTPNTREYFDTPLHALLLVKLPKLVKGDRIDTNALAKACGVTRYTAYKWLRLPRLPCKAATKLIESSEGKLTKQDMFPFLLV